VRNGWWRGAAVAGLALLASSLAACRGADSGSSSGGLDAGEPEDGGAWHLQLDAAPPIFVPHDASPADRSPRLTPNSVTVNIGINRSIVPDYPGDSCGSIARFLVIDAQGPAGALPHQQVDCQQGSIGWTYFDMPAGYYTATLQLFDQNAAGDLVAVTPARTAAATLEADTGTLIWVDFTYRDFTTTYQGNLKWQVGWVNGDTVHGCDDASPPVVGERLTVLDDQQRVLRAWTENPDAEGLVTDGSATGTCRSYGPSDAEVLPSLTWGVYTVTIEGIAASGETAFCVRRQLFATKGEGIIYRLLATADGC
jgi:hypothetical protein